MNPFKVILLSKDNLSRGLMQIAGEIYLALLYSFANKLL